MDEELLEIYDGDFSPSQVRGFIEVSASCRADVAGVRVTRTVTSRRQFKISDPAEGCDIDADPSDPLSPGAFLASMVHINPVEVGRLIERTREPIPRGTR